MRQFEEKKVLENVRRVGAYLYEKLDEIAASHADVVEHRGVGLMQGLEFDHPVAEIINKALDKGLVLINAGTNIIRFLPPLVITEADVDAMLEILKECL